MDKARTSGCSSMKSLVSFWHPTSPSMTTWMPRLRRSFSPSNVLLYYRQSRRTEYRKMIGWCRIHMLHERRFATTQAHNRAEQGKATRETYILYVRTPRFGVQPSPNVSFATRHAHRRGVNCKQMVLTREKREREKDFREITMRRGTTVRAPAPGGH